MKHLKKALGAAAVMFALSGVIYAGPLEQLKASGRIERVAPEPQKAASYSGEMSLLMEIAPRSSQRAAPVTNDRPAGSNKSSFSGNAALRVLIYDILDVNAASGPDSKVFKKIRAAYLKVNVHEPEAGQDFSDCLVHPSGLASARTGDLHVFMCRKLVEMDDTMLTAQILIHEMTHVIGIADECEAVRLEMAAMRNANYVPAHRELATKCGL
ncbi:MAG: hypothetical protein NTY45_10655 [Elusimicrobia bacterium]|nr:hypothetical protein [Elusimicrobiota bacterium]